MSTLLKVGQMSVGQTSVGQTSVAEKSRHQNSVQFNNLVQVSFICSNCVFKVRNLLFCQKNITIIWVNTTLGRLIWSANLMTTNKLFSINFIGIKKAKNMKQVIIQRKIPWGTFNFFYFEDRKKTEHGYLRLSLANSNFTRQYLFANTCKIKNRTEKSRKRESLHFAQYSA